MKYYEAQVRIFFNQMRESRHCPSQWHGSGCYNVLTEVVFTVVLSIWAASSQKAQQLAQNYDYQPLFEGAEDIVSSVEEIKEYEFEEQCAETVEVYSCHEEEDY